MAEQYPGTGRLKYIEPTIPSNVGGRRDGNDEDSILFPYENYSMAIDLSIVVTDRYACGNANYSNKTTTTKFSSSNGTLSFIGGTNGQLTTNYTDISMTNPKANSQECLGIESINITYNSWLYPQVVIKFVDVRGGTVMAPAEDDYYEKGNQSGWNGISSLYKALFTFPYPIYTLKVKGFYGKGATYKLACQKTDIEMDASTGNFNITAQFVGYMFGIYADIPLQYLAVAPFTTAGKKYWETRVTDGVFRFKDINGNPTTPYINFLELRKRLAEVSQNGEVISAAAEAEQTESDYSARLTELDTLKNTNPFKKVKKAVISGSKNLKGGGRTLDNVSIVLLDKGIDSINNFETQVDGYYGLLKEYDEKYKTNYHESIFGDMAKIGTKKSFQCALKVIRNEGGRISLTNNFMRGNSVVSSYALFAEKVTDWLEGTDAGRLVTSTDATEARRIASEYDSNGCYTTLDYIIQEYQGKNNADYTDFLNRVISVTGSKNNTPFLMFEGDVNSITENVFSDETKKLNDEREKRAKEYKNKQNELIEKLLGFRPSIKNMYDLAFAHMETFMHCYYNCLETIDNQLNGVNGQSKVERAKATYNITEDDATDTENEAKNPTLGGYLPPFPAFYKTRETDKAKENIWPGNENITNGDNLAEVPFVLELLGAAEKYNEDSIKLDDYIANLSGATSNGEAVNSSTGVLIPITPYDFVHKDKNPYAELKEDITANRDIEGKLIFKFAMRAFNYLSSEMNKITSGRYGDNTIGRYNTMANLFGKIEAMNFYKGVGSKPSESLFTFIKKYADGDSEKKEKRIFTDVISHELKDRSLEQYATMSKAWDFGGANTSDRLFKEYHTKAGASGLIYYFNQNPNYWFLPLDVSSINQIKRDLIDGDKLIYDESYLNTRQPKTEINFNGSFKYGQPLEGGNFVVINSGQYIKGIVENIKNEAIAGAGGGTLSLDSGEVDAYNNRLFIHSNGYEGDEKSYATTGPNIVKKADGSGASELEIRDGLANGTARDEFFIKYPTQYDETYDRSILNNPDETQNLIKSQESIESKAFVFLFSIPVQGYNYGLSTFVHDPDKEEVIKAGQNMVVLKLRLLREGALYWRYDMMDKGNSDPIWIPSKYKHPEKYQGFVESSNDNLDTFYLYETGDTSSYATWTAPKGSAGRRETLKQMFISWANSSDEGEGFKVNVDRLMNLSLYEERNPDKGLNLELVKQQNKTVTNNYQTDAIKLQTFLNHMYFDLCTVVDYYGGYSNLDENGTLVVGTEYMRQVFERFMKALSDIYGKTADAIKDNPTEAARQIANAKIEDPFNSPSLRLSTYMTLKNLYDKWICSARYGRDTWKLGSKNNVSDFDNFTYVDSFYNDIGNALTVNVTEISNFVSMCLPTSEAYVNKEGFQYQGKTLYEYLTGIAEHSQGILLALPQKFGLVSEKDVKDMFTPFAFVDSWDEDTSSFVFMYSYKPSEHLGDPEAQKYDMNGWSRDGDGFNLTDADVTGRIFEDNGKGYNVPGFGVTYAKQNQSIFKNITLTSENAGTTEAGLAATFNIAATENAKGPREATLFGQDIYRVYSQYSFTCGVEMMGNMQITPLMYFQLNNVPLWKGAYMIKKVVHDITAGNVTTKFEGLRVNKYAIPIGDLGLIVNKSTDVGISGAGRTVTTLVDNQGTILTDEQSGNINAPAPALPDGITPSATNPLFVFTPAHGKGDKARVDENNWSANLISTVLKDKMKAANLQCFVSNIASESYNMTEARQLANKYGSECVVSIVPHWNMGMGKDFVSYYGLDGGQTYPINRKAPFLSQCFVNAANETKAKSYTKLPKGAMSGSASSTNNMQAKSGGDAKDPALNWGGSAESVVIPPAAVLELWFGDYYNTALKDEIKFTTIEQPTISQIVDLYEDGPNKDVKSGDTYGVMAYWLRDNEGLNAIADMIVKGCLNYVGWIKNGKGDMDGVSVTTRVTCEGGEVANSNAPTPTTPGGTGGGNTSTEREKYITNFIQHWEGGYAGNIDGAVCTMKGVVLATYRSYYGKDKTCDDLKNITDEQWFTIFRKGFYDKMKGDQISNDSICLLVVDWGYNAGVGSSTVKRIQASLGVPQTGSMDDATISALNGSPAEAVFENVRSARESFYKNLAASKPSKAKFLKGWLNRLNSITFKENS